MGTNVGTPCKQSVHQLLQSGQGRVVSSFSSISPRFSQRGQSTGSRAGRFITVSWCSSGNYVYSIIGVCQPWSQGCEEERLEGERLRYAEEQIEPGSR